MTVCSIVTAPNPILRSVSEPIELNDPTLHDLVQDLIDTLHDRNALGIAAIQIGVAKRVLLVKLPTWPRPEIMVNPEIISLSDEDRVLFEEGCLSMPEETRVIARAQSVYLRYFEPSKGAAATTRLTGLASIVFQHEFDHLNGVLMSDYD